MTAKKPDAKVVVRKVHHGTIEEFSKYGCRCEPCTKAALNYNLYRSAPKQEDRYDDRVMPVAAFLFSHEGWMDEAACADLPQELFFPENLTGDKKYLLRKMATALEVCANCPVQDECDDYRKRTETGDGIWAGVLWSRGKVILGA